MRGGGLPGVPEVLPCFSQQCIAVCDGVTCGDTRAWMPVTSRSNRQQSQLLSFIVIEAIAGVSRSA